MRIYLIYDCGNPEQNMEQVEGFVSESQALARCEVLNLQDYPDLVLDEDGESDEDHWCVAHVDVEVGS